MTAREHARLLGLLMWIFAGFQIVMVAVVAVVYPVLFGTVFSAQMAQMPDRSDQPPPEAIVGFIVIVMIFVFVMTVAFAIPKIVAGYGLRNDKSWAKIWAIIACCLAVLSFPFGTALGIYGFIFIFGEKGKVYFNMQPASNFPPPPPAAGSWG